MLDAISKFFSYLCHPLIMPLIGVLAYFKITPKYIPWPFFYAKLMAIVILTVVVPLLFYFMLRNLNRVDSIFIDDVSQRRVPLFFQIILCILIVTVILSGYEFPELYNFFLGILIASSLAFIAALIKFKISLHMIGLGGVLAFIFSLSIRYESNLLLPLAGLCSLVGLVAFSRLQLKVHTMEEIGFGLSVGILSQLGIFYYAFIL